MTLPVDPIELVNGVQMRRVKRPKFTLKSPQVWHDEWRNKDRVMRFKGECVVCGRRTYGFDDGENDPRGVLGDHSAQEYVAADYDKVGPDVPACFMCQNDYDRYKYGLQLAERQWADPIPSRVEADPDDWTDDFANRE